MRESERRRSRLPLPWRRRAALFIAGALLSTSVAHIAGEARRDQAPRAHAHEITLTAIRLAGDAAQPLIELTANSALPEPVVGVLEGPSRIYLDLVDVRMGAAVPPEGLGVVTRVRAALHSVSPLVTRVVIDLSESRGHTLDLSQRQSGLIRISIAPAGTGRAASPGRVPSRPEVAPERAPAVMGKPGRSSEENGSRSPAPRAATAAPDALPRPGPQYRARIAPIVEQLDAAVRVLESIDQRKVVLLQDLDSAAKTIDVVHDELAAMQPTRDAIPVHDTLRSACTLASTAVELTRAAHGHDLPWNASSAAAGSLILLDRARMALQAR